MRFPSRLTFDPGHTTGIAFHREGNILFTATLWHEELEVNFLQYLLEKFEPQQVVVEKVPPNNPDPITLRLFGLIVLFYESKGLEVLTVSPGIWKPVRAKTLPFWSEHVKDAVDLSFHNF